MNVKIYDYREQFFFGEIPLYCYRKNSQEQYDKEDISLITLFTSQGEYETNSTFTEFDVLSNLFKVISVEYLFYNWKIHNICYRVVLSSDSKILK